MTATASIDSGIITARQRQVYQHLVSSLLHEQRFPTYRELALGLELDPETHKNAITGHLKALQRHGLLTMLPCGCLRLEGVRMALAWETDTGIGRLARALWEESREESASVESDR